MMGHMNASGSNLDDTDQEDYVPMRERKSVAARSMWGAVGARRGGGMFDLLTATNYIMGGEPTAHHNIDAVYVNIGGIGTMVKQLQEALRGCNVFVTGAFDTPEREKARKEANLNVSKRKIAPDGEPLPSIAGSPEKPSDEKQTSPRKAKLGEVDDGDGPIPQFITKVASVDEGVFIWNQSVCTRARF